MVSIELRAAAQQMLEAWQTATYGHPSHHKATLLAMTALKATLAEPTTEESSAVEPVQDHLRDATKMVQEPVACLIGTKGSAFDSPTTKRAYTYAEQPGNVVASRLGLACNAAASQSAGDSIDRGLGLLQELQRQGFGVFDLGAEYAAPPQQPAEPVQEPVAQRGAMFRTHPAVERQRSVEAAVRPACGVDPAAKAQPVQEPKPVAWRFEARHIDSAWAAAVTLKHPGPEGIYMRNVMPLYAHPPQRLPLTDEEIERLWYPSAVIAEPGKRRVAFGRAVERAHGIGGEG